MTFDSDSEITPQLLETINILEALENLMDAAPSLEVEEILQEAWLKISQTFPEDFKEATYLDAGAEGLRRYLKVKAFFANPTQNPISREELEEYYRNHAQTPEDATDAWGED